jgi:hypothetical protein
MDIFPYYPLKKLFRNHNQSKKEFDRLWNPKFEKPGVTNKIEMMPANLTYYSSMMGIPFKILASNSDSIFINDP